MVGGYGLTPCFEDIVVAVLLLIALIALVRKTVLILRAEADAADASRLLQQLL